MSNSEDDKVTDLHVEATEHVFGHLVDVMIDAQCDPSHHLWLSSTTFPSKYSQASYKMLRGLAA